MIRGFQDFILEMSSTKTDDIDVQSFIDHILDEMRWNRNFNAVPEAELVKPDEECKIGDNFYKMKFSEILKGMNCYIVYTGADGQSVRKDIVEACEKFGLKSAKVKVLFNGIRNVPHSYLIGLNVSDRALARLKHEKLGI